MTNEEQPEQRCRGGQTSNNRRDLAAQRGTRSPTTIDEDCRQERCFYNTNCYSTQVLSDTPENAYTAICEQQLP
ncbi:unnamed protein product [Ectocarpus sp. 12 AP-2014]